MNKGQLLDALDLEGAASLVVAKRSPTRFSGQHVPVDTNVAADLREMAAGAVARLRSLEMKNYEPDIRVEPKDNFMYIPATLIANYESDASEAAVEPASAERLIDIDNGVIQDLMNVATMEVISAQDIRRSGYNMYAIIIGDDPNDRTIFIKHANPQKFSKPGRMLTAFSETLTRFDKPIFAFEDGFDIVISRHGLVVVNQATFEKTFRDVQVLAARHSQRVAAIAQALPLDNDSLDVLAQLATKPAVARKLRAISENGHLSGLNVTVEEIQAKAAACNVDPDTLIRDGKLFFTEETILPSLKFLNDDVFQGAFTGQTYEAGSKSRRTSAS